MNKNVFRLRLFLLSGSFTFVLFFLSAAPLWCGENDSTVLNKNVRWQTVQDPESNSWNVQILRGDQVLLRSPKEGLWSIATAWKDDAPDVWKHVPAANVTTVGNWTILSGSLQLPEGEILLRDSCSVEDGLLKIVRRFEYQGEKPLADLTLSVRWEVLGAQMQAFLPGILYYGNPSGERNTPNKVPVYHGTPGEFAIFEEHRFPMPFASLEDASNLFSATLYTIPTPALRGDVPDQFWSLGVRAREMNLSELVQYSGFIGFNHQNSVAKALQSGPMKYPKSAMTMIPGTIIEKTFYLDLRSIEREGTGFQEPIVRSLKLFKPFYAEDFPTLASIIMSKLAFARSRFIEGDDYAGFNMYPSEGMEPQIVMGWCGQADSLGFALQRLEKFCLQQLTSPEERDALEKWLVPAVQRSLDFLTTSPMTQDGFSVVYSTKRKAWLDSRDPVSIGQGMYNFAKAIAAARSDKRYDTTKWEDFLKRACVAASERILDENWNPRSTAEAFYIAPLILSSRLFNNETFQKAAVKAAEYYAERHLSMKEPYWGGTLDATCEDKEGAWAAFQGFLTMYEVTKEEKYLVWARHACDVCLSCLVVWDIPLPPGRLSDHRFRTRGWTVVSPQNQHLDVYGVLFAPEVWRIGTLCHEDAYKEVAEVMFRSCGQLIDPWGSQGEQIQHTNFAQRGDMTDVLKLRGGYSERWTVFWITAHFLNSAARQIEYTK